MNKNSVFGMSSLFQTEMVIYILDPWTNVLVSNDGPGGTSHALPTSGLVR